MLKRLSIITICATAFGISSCNTEFSVNGNYEVTPIVMGVIDHGDSVHIIKITKAFLGDGNNLLYAKEADSNYFQSVDGKIVEYELVENSEEFLDPTGREWTLLDTTFTNKDTGVFYNPEQKAYYFFANDLKEDHGYELVATVHQTDLKDTVIKARTGMINGFSVPSSVTISNQINWNNATVADDDDYKAFKFTVSEAYNASLYSYKYTFRWREYYTDGTSQDFSRIRINGDIVQESHSAPSGHLALFQGEDFFKWLGGYTNTGGEEVAGIISFDPLVDRRIVLGIDVQVAIAHHNLEKFMDVTKPQTGIAQAQPEFTNVEGGLGLFSSRHIFVLENYRLYTNSVEELCQGQYTQDLQFCSQYPEDVGESYYCP